MFSFLSLILSPRRCTLKVLEARWVMSVWEGNAKIILILLCAFFKHSPDASPIPAQHYASSASHSPGTSKVSKSVSCEERADLVRNLVNMGSSRRPFPLAQGIGYRKMDKGLQLGGFLCTSWLTRYWGILASRSLLGGGRRRSFQSWSFPS